MTAVPDLLSFDCPRCGAASDERYYGPCQSCREALASTAGPDRTSDSTGDHHDGGTERFEPPMHVVPNHVATKD